MLYLIRQFGRVVGGLSGSAAAAMWAWAMWSGSIEWTYPLAVFLISVVMLILSIAAVIASLRGHSHALVFLFVVSFFPIGFYLFTVDHWIQWIGAANIGYLLAATLMWESQEASKNKS